MSHIATITWLTFHEALRRRMVLAGVVLGIGFLGLYNLGFIFLSQEATELNGSLGSTIRDTALNFLATAGLNVVHFLAIALAIFASVEAISGEIQSHTIQAIATKPIRRYQIVLGKWLGLALLIVPYVLLLAAGIILSVYVLSGYMVPNAPQVLALITLQALLLLSLSLLLGTRYTTLTNGVVLFMLYGLAYVGSWIEQIGVLMNSRAAVNLGIITSLLMPVEALWRLAVSYLSPPLFSLDNRLSVLFGGTSVPSPAMVAYSVAFALIALLLAIQQFSHRDL